MPFFMDDPLRVEYVDGYLWILIEDFSYLDIERTSTETIARRIHVPLGFTTDFASIPRFFWRWLPPTGEYGKAAVIHDFLYQYADVDGVPVTKAYADAVFRRAMADLGVGTIRRNIMYAAVRAFGRGVWSREP